MKEVFQGLTKEQPEDRHGTAWPLMVANAWLCSLDRTPLSTLQGSARRSGRSKLQLLPWQALAGCGSEGCGMRGALASEAPLRAADLIVLSGALLACARTLRTRRQRAVRGALLT